LGAGNSFPSLPAGGGVSGNSFLSRYRVDNVPAPLRPPYWLYAYGTATLVWAYATLVNLTSRIEITGAGQIEPDKSYVFCFWHTYIPLFFAAFRRHHRHAWMQHPSWLMKHIHLLLRFQGVKRIVLGSTGHGGRAAADELVELLRAGYSTVILPDGPHGPPFELHSGVIHVSCQSGSPIVPMHFEAAHHVVARGWDRKRVPLPFNRLKVHYEPPLVVGDRNLAEVRDVLVAALGRPSD